MANQRQRDLLFTSSQVQGPAYSRSGPFEQNNNSFGQTQENQHYEYADGEEIEMEDEDDMEEEEEEMDMEMRMPPPQHAFQKPNILFQNQIID